MMGGDLPSNDDWTTKLLTNPEVIAVDQHSHGNHPVMATDRTVIWTAQPDKGNGYYVAVFNIGDTANTVPLDWTLVGLAPGAYAVRDLWSGKDLGLAKTISVPLRPHACALYRVTAGAMN
jgi:hypothetical protein